MIDAGKLLVALFAAWAFALGGSAAAAAAPAEKVLFNFERDFDVTAVETRDAEVRFSGGEGAAALRIATGHAQSWPGITLGAPGGRWDLSAFEYLAVDLKNVGPNRVKIGCRIDSPGPDGKASSCRGDIELQPGEAKTFKVALQRRLPTALAPKLFGMRGYPGGLSKDRGIDAGNVERVLLFVSRPSEDHAFEVDNCRAGGSYGPATWLAMDAGRFFPLIDQYGQFIHDDWPGKTGSAGDLARHKQEEEADLAAHPGPESWNRYGGWEAGPQLEATGHFRPEKHRGKWWLVDPAGRLFWSHGIDCVRSTTGYTPITDREFYFAELPAKASPFGPFYGKGGWAPHGYYQDKGAYETYNLTGANLLRKYGPDWKTQFADLCHRRLRSWSMNTIANWSDEEIYLERKTPYCVSISAGGRKPIEGSSGYWGKFPDPFDPSLAGTLQNRMAREKDKSAGDPWCIGYFVDNELAWGDEVSLAMATLASPPDQAAKRVFVADLEAKYGSIAKLNEAWGTRYASWEALAESRTPPDRTKAHDDLAAFYTKTAEAYFRTCREAVKEVAPENLYLGCRFAWVNDRAVRAAAKHCDVIGFNKYSDSVAGFRLPEGLDKPAIIGEFHFGALDRGMFHTGLRPVADQAARAKAYRDYVTGGLKNPWLVGTHWFQYGDQATTGRGDGENYQIGFLDVCDTPYPETIQASRQIGSILYRLRLGEP